jgi:hypothetical protein
MGMDKVWGDPGCEWVRPRVPQWPCSTVLGEVCQGSSCYPGGFGCCLGPPGLQGRGHHAAAVGLGSTMEGTVQYYLGYAVVCTVRMGSDGIALAPSNPPARVPASTF